MKLHCYPFKTMGSPCELRIYSEDSHDASNIAREVINEVKRLNDKYTRYTTTSITSEINQSAGTGVAVQVDEETQALLNYADTCYQQSDGLFDITSGILRHAWDFTSNQIPTQSSIEALLPKVGWDIVKNENSTITLPLKGMEIDFGGVVKEYAADCAANLCRKLGIRHGMVNLSGDISIVGSHPDGRAWNIGITNPQNKTDALATLWLSRGAVTSSGDYERCIVIDNKNYSHILHPKTGWPVEGFCSVSVVSEHCLIAGSASTIAMLKGNVDGEKWLKNLGLPYLCVNEDSILTGTLFTEPIRQHVR